MPPIEKRQLSEIVEPKCGSEFHPRQHDHLHKHRSRRWRSTRPAPCESRCKASSLAELESSPHTGRSRGRLRKQPFWRTSQVCTRKRRSPQHVRVAPQDRRRVLLLQSPSNERTLCPCDAPEYWSDQSWRRFGRASGRRVVRINPEVGDPHVLVDQYGHATWDNVSCHLLVGKPYSSANEVICQPGGDQAPWPRDVTPPSATTGGCSQRFKPWPRMTPAPIAARRAEKLVRRGWPGGSQREWRW